MRNVIKTGKEIYHRGGMGWSASLGLGAACDNKASNKVCYEDSQGLNRLVTDRFCLDQRGSCKHVLNRKKECLCKSMVC